MEFLWNSGLAGWVFVWSLRVIERKLVVVFLRKHVLLWVIELDVVQETVNSGIGVFEVSKTICFQFREGNCLKDPSISKQCSITGNVTVIVTTRVVMSEH